MRVLILFAAFGCVLEKWANPFPFWRVVPIEEPDDQLQR